tara:strand:+ start:1475 stop:2458 length:984 start_codon:yes stop_codon:yes gene_type:complete
MELFWLKKFAEEWLKTISQNRSPHAVLLTGKKGVGKRAAASWISRLKLNIDSSTKVPVFPIIEFEHPDLHSISPIEDGKSIGIDQIRSLEKDLNLTSHGSYGKVAIIESANNMTVNAANGLLKLLEEPTNNTLLVLVSDVLGKLPATILSRCHQMNILIPPKDLSIKWLNDYETNASYTDALKISGGAPLSAIDAIEKIETTKNMLKDLQMLETKRVSAIEVSARWSKLEVNFVLNFMSQQVMQTIKEKMIGNNNSESYTDNSFLDRTQRRDLFCYLDNINQLSNKSAGSYNIQLTFDSLLIDWANNLSGCSSFPSADGMDLMLNNH